MELDYRRIPKDVMKIILDYYLCDYTWMSIGLGKHIAIENFICCEQCKNIKNCKQSRYHNLQSLIKNLMSLPSLKRVCKFWNYYITKWFHKNWDAKSWKKLHHINNMIDYHDRATPQKIVRSFFLQLFGIIGSNKEFGIYSRKRIDGLDYNSHLINVTIEDDKLLLFYTCKSYYSHKNVQNYSYVIKQCSDADFGWCISKPLIDSVRDLDICDIMSLLQLPNMHNMIEPNKFKKLKIRYHKLV